MRSPGLLSAIMAGLQYPNEHSKLYTMIARWMVNPSVDPETDEVVELPERVFWNMLGLNGLPAPDEHKIKCKILTHANMMRAACREAKKYEELFQDEVPIAEAIAEQIRAFEAWLLRQAPLKPLTPAEREPPVTNHAAARVDHASADRATRTKRTRRS